MEGVDSSFGLIGLVASFGIAYYMSRQYKVDGIPSGLYRLLLSQWHHSLLPKLETVFLQHF